MLTQNVCQVAFKKVIPHLRAVYVCTTASIKKSVLFRFLWQRLREQPGTVEGQRPSPSFESGGDAERLKWEIFLVTSDNSSHSLENTHAVDLIPYHCTTICEMFKYFCKNLVFQPEND